MDPQQCPKRTPRVPQPRRRGSVSARRDGPSCCLRRCPTAECLGIGQRSPSLLGCTIRVAGCSTTPLITERSHCGRVPGCSPSQTALSSMAAKCPAASRLAMQFRRYWGRRSPKRYAERSLSLRVVRAHRSAKSDTLPPPRAAPNRPCGHCRRCARRRRFHRSSGPPRQRGYQ